MTTLMGHASTTLMGRGITTLMSSHLSKSRSLRGSEAQCLTREPPQGLPERPQHYGMHFRVPVYICDGPGGASPPSIGARMAQEKWKIL